MKLFKHVCWVALISVTGCGDGDRAAGGGGSETLDFAAYVPKTPALVSRSESVPLFEQRRVAEDPVSTAVVAPNTVEGALAQGRALMDNGDFAGAKKWFEAAVTLDGKRPEPHIELARLYILSNERGHAMAEANKAVKLSPLSSLAWNTKGRAELHRFSYDDAIAAFSRAIELNPDNVWAWNNLGYTELLLKNYDDAAQHLAEATSRPGATGYMFNNLGTALEQLDRLDEARTAFEAGGKLGSKEALASRTRLEGVKSIALFLPQGNPELGDSNRDLDSEFDADDSDEHGEEPSAEGGSSEADSGTDSDAASDVSGDAASEDQPEAC